MAKQPEPQRCGNCRWWGEVRDSHATYYYLRPCKYVLKGPVPDAVQVNYRYSHDGTTCPCHERKEMADE